MTTKPPAPGDILTGDGDTYVLVPDLDDRPWRVKAAALAIEHSCLSEDDTTTAAAAVGLAPHGEAVWLAHHGTDSDDEFEARGCVCDNRDWWCADARGKRLPWWQFAGTAIERAVDAAVEDRAEVPDV